MSSNHPILCHPFLLPSIFPSIRVFSNESALRIRWPKYWSSILNYYSTRRQNVGFILTPSPNPHRPGQKITLAALVNVWDIFQCVKISCIVHLSLCFFISVSNKNNLKKKFLEHSAASLESSLGSRLENHRFRIRCGWKSEFSYLLATCF